MISLRPFAFASLACCYALSLGSTYKYNVSQGGKKLGTAIVQLTGNDANGYIEDSVVSLAVKGQTFSEHQTDHFGKNGVSTSTADVIKVQGRVVSVASSFSKTGVTAKVSIDGKLATTKTLPMQPHVPHLDVNHLWFSHVRPKVGESLTYQTFSSQDVTWHVQTAKYKGKVRITVSGKSVMGNQVDQTGDKDNSTLYFDDRGELLLGIQGKDVRIERVTGS